MISFDAATEKGVMTYRESEREREKEREGDREREREREGERERGGREGERVNKCHNEKGLTVTSKVSAIPLLSIV